MKPAADGTIIRRLQNNHTKSVDDRTIILSLQMTEQSYEACRQKYFAHFLKFSGQLVSSLGVPFKGTSLPRLNSSCAWSRLKEHDPHAVNVLQLNVPLILQQFFLRGLLFFHAPLITYIRFLSLLPRCALFSPRASF